jgi:hypothetical protein
MVAGPRNHPFQSVASLPVISPAHFALTLPAVAHNLPVRSPFLIAHGLCVQVESGAVLECRSSSRCTFRSVPLARSWVE